MTLKQVPTIVLGDIAFARSGDKGNHANIGVAAYSPVGYEFLLRELTSSRIAEYFQGLGLTHVERFELPNIESLNFVLYDALGGGASRSLRIDTQGKLLGTALMNLELTEPLDIKRMYGGPMHTSEQFERWEKGILYDVDLPDEDKLK